MKIAMLTSFFYPHIGGTEKYVEDLSAELARRGHSVTVFTHNKAGDDDRKIYRGFEIVRIPSLWNRYQPFLTFFRYKRLLDFDVVHSHLPPYIFTRNIARRFQGIPHVATYHSDLEINDKFWLFRNPRWFTKLVNGFLARLAKDALVGCDRIVVTSQGYADDSAVLKALGRRRTVIPIGIDIDTFNETARSLGGATRNGMSLLYVGRLAPSKGIHHLIEAVGIVRGRGIDVTLKIVGEGRMGPALKRLAKSLGAEEAVKFVGQLSFEDLARAYLDATALVLPSVVRIEAFGIVQLEALALGTPVIASELSGVRDVVERSGGGYLFKTADTLSLADTIARALENPEETRRKAEAGQAYVAANYTWAQIAGQFEQLYRSTIQNKDVSPLYKTRSRLLRAFES